MRAKEEMPWLLCEVTPSETSIVFFGGLWNSQQSGPRPMAMPMDAYRKDDSFLLQLDLPGVASDSIELSVEDNVLTISAERPAPPSGEGVESVIGERTFGTFSRRRAW